MPSIIQELIEEGVLVLYHDYRAGHLIDLSGNGNDGVITNEAWQGNGLKRVAANSKITVADSPELQLTALSIIILGDFQQYEGNKYFIAKVDAGGSNYGLCMASTTQWGFLDSVPALRTINSAPIGRSCVAINATNGGTPEGFVNGVSIGNYSGAVTITQDNADLVLGAYYTSGNNPKSIIEAILICNRVLTATEHSRLYAELENLTWPSVSVSRSIHPTAANEVLWKTDWGIRAGDQNFTSGYIENSPFQRISGTHKVSVQTIGTRHVKCLECVVAGLVGLDLGDVKDQDDPAYGSFNFWFRKNAATDLPLIIIASEFANWNDAAQNGYMLHNSATDRLILYRITAGGVALVGQTETIYAEGSWRRILVSRASGTGAFVVYHSDNIRHNEMDAIISATDNNHTDSKFVVLSMQAGDMIALADGAGGFSFAKHAGVITP
jgi:hypothetical protein